MKIFSGNVNEIPAASLAYIGDAVFELAVRVMVLGDGHQKSGSLHKKSIQYAKAQRQAQFAKWLMEDERLTETERAALLRGRNTDPGSMAKHADPVDYRWATGLECLLGFLYLRGEQIRLEEILELLFNSEA